MGRGAQGSSCIRRYSHPEKLSYSNVEGAINTNILYQVACIPEVMSSSSQHETERLSNLSLDVVEEQKEKSAFITHTVTKLDTLAGLAIKYGVEVMDIKRANGLMNDMQMFARKTLRVPLPGPHSPAACKSPRSRLGPPLSSSSYRGSRMLGSSASEAARLHRLHAPGSPPRGEKSPLEKRPVTPAMGLLRGYYGLKSPPPSNMGAEEEGTELFVYRSDSGRSEEEEEEELFDDGEWASGSSSRKKDSVGGGGGSKQKPFNQKLPGGDSAGLPASRGSLGQTTGGGAAAASTSNRWAYSDKEDPKEDYKLDREGGGSFSEGEGSPWRRKGKGFAAEDAAGGLGYGSRERLTSGGLWVGRGAGEGATSRRGQGEGQSAAFPGSSGGQLSSPGRGGTSVGLLGDASPGGNGAESLSSGSSRRGRRSSQAEQVAAVIEELAKAHRDNFVPVGIAGEVGRGVGEEEFHEERLTRRRGPRGDSKSDREPLSWDRCEILPTVSGEAGYTSDTSGSVLEAGSRVSLRRGAIPSRGPGAQSTRARQGAPSEGNPPIAPRARGGDRPNGWHPAPAAEDAFDPGGRGGVDSTGPDGAVGGAVEGGPTAESLLGGKAVDDLLLKIRKTSSSPALQHNIVRKPTSPSGGAGRMGFTSGKGIGVSGAGKLASRSQVASRSGESQNIPDLLTGGAFEGSGSQAAGEGGSGSSRSSSIGRSESKHAMD